MRLVGSYRHPLVNEPWVRCAYCDGPVQEMRITDDLFGRRRVLTVRCHGEVEVSTLTAEDLIGLEEIRLGDAFTAQVPPPEPTRYLPPPKRQITLEEDE